MKVQGNYLNLVQGAKNGVQSPVKPSFGAGYAPKDYRAARELADAIYDHSNGLRKWLLRMERSKGEMQNNTVTAIGTAGVAPIFIAFNPFSKEDTNSKKYTAARQFVSAPITLFTQLFVMSKYDKWLDKHAAFLGVPEIDLAAKPPKTVLKATAEHNWLKHYAECLEKGVEPPKHGNWVKNEILRLQDEAFYKTLDELRKNKCNGKVIQIEDVVKMDLIKEKRKEHLARILKEEYNFTDSQINKIKDYEGFVTKTGMKICDKKDLVFEDVKERIDSVVMQSAKDEMEQIIAEEVKVKLKTSELKQEMVNELEPKKKKLMRALAKKPNSKEAEEKYQKELLKETKEIYEAKLKKLKEQVDVILAKAADKVTAEDKVLVHAYNKLVRRQDDPINGLKNHGLKEPEVRESVMIKKYLINRINKAEAKFKGWKDRSGVIIGLFILPVTCSILNWVFPRFMNEFFPKLSAAKAASKAKALGLPVENEKKKAKEVK